MLKILLVGLAGEGLETASYIIGDSFLRDGLYPAIFPSKFFFRRGERLSYEIYISKGRNFERKEENDLVILTKEEFLKEFNGKRVIVNSNKERLEGNILYVDMDSVVVKSLGKKLYSSSILGSVSGFLGIPRYSSCLNSIKNTFRGGFVEKNVSIFEEIYERVRKMVVR